MLFRNSLGSSLVLLLWEVVEKICVWTILSKALQWRVCDLKLAEMLNKASRLWLTGVQSFVPTSFTAFIEAGCSIKQLRDWLKGCLGQQWVPMHYTAFRKACLSQGPAHDQDTGSRGERDLISSRWLDEWMNECDRVFILCSSVLFDCNTNHVLWLIFSQFLFSTGCVRSSLPLLAVVITVNINLWKSLEMMQNFNRNQTLCISL